MMDGVFSTAGSPVATLGTLTLLVGFLVIAYAGAAGIIGQRTRRQGLVDSALYATWAWTALMCFASSLMIYAFFAHDFRIKYVAHYSDTTMPLFYLIASYWGGLDGSLLFWVWVLSMFSAVALYVNRRRHRDMIGYVIGTIAAVALFFLGLLLYSKNPFSTYLAGAPGEGNGLNPLLQNYWMAIHPPSLYIGYVGMTIPFAFCMAALASGRLDDSWMHSVRVWVLIPWFFLGFGLTLGGLWAYEELGWGGYWAWDPVENAGLIPWFTATAFLHSVMIQERRGMLKVWNVVLVITTFFLTIFGTFMTRSGIVQSVHAFGQDNELALLFLIFMSVMLVVSLGLLFFRLPALQARNQYESLLSREFAFLLNNILLLACAFFVLFATMFPTISEYMMQQRITVGPPVFNRLMGPLGLLLLFLMGAGPLLAWRKTTTRRLIDQFLIPTAVAVVTVVVIAFAWPPSRAMQEVIYGHAHLPLALINFGLVAFTVASIGQEFVRGARVRRRHTGTDWLTAVIGITFAKRRKYGGYLVHLGVAIMFFGFAGKTWSRDKSVTVSHPGETWTMDGYRFTYNDLKLTGNDNRDMVTADVTLARGKDTLARMHPARWHYRTGTQETTTEVDIDRNLGQDVYLVLNGYDSQNKQANFTVYINPFVNWVWIGFGVIATGTAICLLPAALLTGRRGSAAIIALIIVAAAAPARAQLPPKPADPMAPAKPAEAMAPAKHQILPGVTIDDADAPPVARRLWGILKCMCGGCYRETLAECKCAYAKRERDRILAMLAGRDLSTPAKQEAAYQAVLAEFVAQYGTQVLITPPNTPFNRLGWIVPYAAFAGGVVLVALIGRAWVRRGRAATAAAAASRPAAPDPAERSPYEDRLDDELDELDS